MRDSVLIYIMASGLGHFRMCEVSSVTRLAETSLTTLAKKLKFIPNLLRLYLAKL